MDFKQLEAFINVAKYKNFSKAGKVLYLSQPTISMHVSNLEKELGVSLFDRTSKEVNLTPTGKEFLKYALDMINMKNHAIHEITRTENDIKGCIQIATSSTPNLTVLPRAIYTFQKKHPNVFFDVKEKSTHVIIEDICSVNADIGLIGMHMESDRFNTVPLFTDEFVFIASSTSNVPDVISIQDLKDYAWVNRSPQSATRSTVEQAFKEQGMDFSMYNAVVETDDTNLLMLLVERDVGISYMSKRIYLRYVNHAQIKAFDIKGIHPQKHIELITNKRRTLSPAAEDFKEHIIDLFANSKS